MLNAQRKIETPLTTAQNTITRAAAILSTVSKKPLQASDMPAIKKLLQSVGFYLREFDGGFELYIKDSHGNKVFHSFAFSRRCLINIYLKAKGCQ